ncbi:MAG: DUF4388 domain-containing protein, partial [Thermoanaerobaculia bacterium]
NPLESPGMSDDLSIQGDLSETTVPDLVGSVIRSSETGILTLELPGRRDRIFFDGGHIVFASSNDPEYGLAETLLRAGDLTLEQYEAAMERLVVSRGIGALLCELGYLRADDLPRASERQASAIVRDALGHRSGDYTIEFTSDFPPEVMALPLVTDRLIFDGIQRIEAWALISRGLGRLDRVVEIVPGADARLHQLELSEEESYVMSLLHEPQSIEQLCARSYLSDFATCRTLWALLVTQLARGAVVSEVDERRSAAESEYELEALIERYNTLFQTVFGIVFQKVGDHVFDFMDRVVLHLDADKLPYLNGMNFVNEGRIDCDQLLTNLYAAPAGDREAVVHTILNELLYGWMYEVRAEFGPEMESEIVKLTREMQK